MTKLLGFLLRHSRASFLMAVLSGVVGGAGFVGLLALIPVALGADPPERGRLALVFAGLCAATVAARVVMQVAMIRIAQGSVAGLVRNLCERILSLPLPSFESHDPGAITAVLTDDVIALTNALSGLPLLFINTTV